MRPKSINIITYQRTRKTTLTNNINCNTNGIIITELQQKITGKPGSNLITYLQQKQLETHKTNLSHKVNRKKRLNTTNSINSNNAIFFLKNLKKFKRI